jgi:hypothetical protein
VNHSSRRGTLCYKPVPTYAQKGVLEIVADALALEPEGGVNIRRCDLRQGWSISPGCGQAPDLLWPDRDTLVRRHWRKLPTILAALVVSLTSSQRFFVPGRPDLVMVTCI